MTGFDLAVVRDTLLPCFNPASFDEFLLIKLNKRRADIVPAGGLNSIILGVLQIADEEGWDALLIAKAAEARPLKPKVQQLARDYSKGLVGEYKTLSANESVREAYRQLGLTPVGFPTEAELGGLQAMVDPENRMVAMSVWIERAARIEGRVCRIEIDNQAMGTGFLVGPKAVLTNHHVLAAAINDSDLLGKTRVRFDFKQLRDGTILSGTLLKVTQVLDQCPPTQGEARGEPEPGDPGLDQLDYALIEVDGAPGEQPIRVAGAPADGPRRGWICVPDGPAEAFTADRPLLIAQHPLGEPLQLAIDWKSVIGANGNHTRVKHRTNTQRGSSGSPCFDRDWNLIALHHYGDPKYVDNPRFNQAVPMTAIRTRVAKNGHAGFLGGPCD